MQCVFHFTVLEKYTLNSSKSLRCSVSLNHGERHDKIIDLWLGHTTTGIDKTNYMSWLKSPQSLLVTSGSHCSSLDNTATAHFPPSIQSVCLNFVLGQSDHLSPKYSKFSISTLKIQGQRHGQEQTWWSHLKPKVQSICLLFVSWQLDHFGWDKANSIFDLCN